MPSLLELLVLVLHEDGAGGDVDDADGVAAAGGHLGRRLVRVLRVGLEHHLPDLRGKKEYDEYRRDFGILYCKGLAKLL